MTAPALSDRTFNDFDRQAVRELLEALASDECPQCRRPLRTGEITWCRDDEPEEGANR